MVPAEYFLDVAFGIPVPQKRGHQRRHFRNILKAVGRTLDAIEIAADADVIDPRDLHGVIDLVNLNQDNSVSVRDWKSSIHDEFFIRYQWQMRFYAFALRQAVPCARLPTAGRCEHHRGLDRQMCKQRFDGLRE